MTEQERAEALIAGLQRIEGIVVDLRSAIADAVGNIEQLGKVAYGNDGRRGADQMLAALSVDGLYGLVRQRLHAVGLEVLLQRTTWGASEAWVHDVAQRLRRVVA
jgi:hypothetical protein